MLHMREKNVDKTVFGFIEDIYEWSSSYTCTYSHSDSSQRGSIISLKPNKHILQEIKSVWALFIKNSNINKFVHKLTTGKKTLWKKSVKSSINSSFIFILNPNFLISYYYFKPKIYVFRPTLPLLISYIKDTSFLWRSLASMSLFCISKF